MDCNTLPPSANQLILWGNSAQTKLEFYARHIAKGLQADDIEVADAALSIQFSLLKARGQIRERLKELEGER